MCGIAGYARSERGGRPPEDVGVLRRMTATLADRGPDAEGLYLGRQVALGHRRLAVIDPACGAQPMHDAARGLAVVFNGAIYNYRELNRELEALGFRARTRSDTETILHAYAAWGERCVERFDGMFAFVIHDAPRRRLFGARDRMGEKPLYYAASEGLFAFASAPRALLAHPAVPRQLDMEALARYLVFEHVPAPFSIYAGVRKLPRAARFTFDLERGNLAIEPWWELGGPGADAARRPAAEWAERIRAALHDAVERRLAADVPLGVFLSGGIDSAAVAAAMARRIGAERVETFTVGFAEPGFDESAAARRTAGILGTSHHELVASPRDAMDALPEIASILDEPLADASILPTYLLARFAREHVTVALGGDGGDELFAGYQTFQALGAARVYDRAIPAALHRRALRPLAGRLRARDGYMPLDVRAKRFLRGVKVPGHERLWRWIGAFEPEDLAWLMTPEALEQVNPGAVFAQLNWMEDSSPCRDDVVRDCRMLARTYLADGVLAKLDRATMAFGLEARSPLLDARLVALADAVPGRLRVRRGRLKHIFREALRGLVPAEVLDAAKHGFAPPIGAWFRGGLRDALLEALDERSVRARGIFRPEAVRRLVDEHLAGRHDHRKQLFTLFTFQQFHRTWMEQARPGTVRLAA
jgi:asparagine synthase (glutamine-hydrolysing)